MRGFLFPFLKGRNVGKTEYTVEGRSGTESMEVCSLIISKSGAKKLSRKGRKSSFCKYRKNKVIERQKIQGTCFKISALYFKIYGLYFLLHALCFFRQSENVVFLCDFRLKQYKNRLWCKEEKMS